MTIATTSTPGARATRALVWFRRDLRLDDHPALAHALREAEDVWCAFVLDRPLLDPLPRTDRRVEFIRASLVELDARIAALGRRRGARLIVCHGDAAHEIPRLAAALDVEQVVAHHDEDPDGVARDRRVGAALAREGRTFLTFKDHVVFERSEVMTAGGKPYGVFTPYKNAWLRRLRDDPAALAARPSDGPAAGLRLAAPVPGIGGRWRGGAAVPALDEFGFAPAGGVPADPGLHPGATGGDDLLAAFLDRIDDYGDTRDYPARTGPSHLGVHLRFGTLSIRRVVRLAADRAEAGSRGAQAWLSELAWREFYQQVLHHHPRVVGHAFRADCDDIRWEEGPQADAAFAAWCEGRTGYPLVDAGLRQLRDTGYMHNRLRMLAASFLTKDLGVSWRRGEAWFALHLNDFELASNNGGWQWAASTGCDAQPWFRIFNPVTQSERFDPDGAFIRRHVPELAGLAAPAIHAPWRAAPLELAAAGVTPGRHYPAPIVDHDLARARTLVRFGARGKGRPDPAG